MLRKALIQHCTKQLSKNQQSAAFSSHGLSKRKSDIGQVKPVFRYANNHADKTALHDVHGEFTYRALFNESLKLSKEINHALEHKPNERVAFLCPNDAQYVITQWAAWMAGQIVVPLSKLQPTSLLEYYLTDCSANLIVTTEEYADRLKDLATKLNTKILILDKSILAKSQAGKTNEQTEEVKDAQPLQLAPLDAGFEPDFYEKNDAMIIYTSGTTGPPKGVLLTHKNLHAQVNSMSLAWKWSHKDIILHCLPLHHIHGITNALITPLSVGAKIVMLPEFNANEVWSHLLAIKKDPSDRINVFMGVPTMYSKLIEEYDKVFVNNKRQADFIKAVLSQKVRLMVSGSAPLAVPLLERWKEISGHVILERYGMSETGMSLSNPLEGERRPGTVGIPLPHVSVRIHSKDEPSSILVEGDSNSTIVLADPKPGQPLAGDLYVSGPSVFKEYWNKPKATAKEFKDEWFKTGDAVEYSDGFYKILGRSSVDIIKTGGFKVSALEVETCILGHSGVADVAVVGLPDNTWGEKVTAVVVLKKDGETLDLDRLRAWCKERIATYSVPTQLKIVEEIPRNALGKVNKKDLLKTLFGVK